ncbi:MAG: tetratricopeptide repeat protein [Deltaproteobacteria bacterium]|nr:tetratricopeptide repeat protein [Deltaproteobacteria bacterium]
MGIRNKIIYYSAKQLCFVFLIFALASQEVAFAGNPDKRAPQGAMSDQDEGLLYMQGRQKALEGKYDEAAKLLEQALKAEPENPYINFQLAEAYFRLDQEEKAEACAKKAIEKEPNNAEYRALLGGIYASSKRYMEAKEQYSKMLELDPNNSKVSLLLGILEAESGQLDKGVETVSKAIDKDPDNVMGYFYRAKIYVEQDQLKKAQADLEKCLALKPNFSEAGVTLAMLYERRGDSNKAIEVYTRIGGSGRFKKRLAQLYLNRNEMQKALEALLEYEAIEPQDYTARVKIALIYFELKQYDKAIIRFQAILKEEPSADNVRFYLGAVYEESKEYNKALTEFKKVKDTSFYKEAMLHVGFILKEMGKLSEAIAFGKKLIAEHPELSDFYDMQASLYEHKKDYKAAIAVIDQGLLRFSNEEKLLYFKGALEDKLGNREKAIGTMKKILEQNGNNPHALNFLGYTYAEMGNNLEEAEKYIRLALTLRPKDGFIEDSLGWVLFKRDKLDEALETLEKAAKMQPGEAVIYEHLGDVYSRKQQYAKAVEMYQKAIALSEKKDRELAKKLESKVADLQKKERIPSNH